MVSHATGRGSGQPTPAQFKELFAQIESGKVNKGRLQEFLRGSTQTVTVEVAQEVMGKKNFFGPNEWVRFFGKKVQIANVPEIPWSQAELENPEINQEHFLFLGLDRLDGKPLNLPTWHKVYSGEAHPKFYWDWYLSHKFAQVSCEPRWYLMPVGILEGSRSFSYDRQVALLPDEYEVPTAPARVTANVLYYLLNKKYLDTDYWARTSDKSDGGRRVLVLGYSAYGLRVDYWSDDAHDGMGVSASRKF
jgi:hypothetical protein